MNTQTKGILLMLAGVLGLGLHPLVGGCLIGFGLSYLS